MKYISGSVVVLSALGLSACSMTSNQNRWISKEVIAQKVSVKRTLLVGRHAPKAENSCHFVGSKSYTWATERFKGMFHMSGGYSLLSNHAVDYAKLHPAVNYAYIFIPDQTHLMGINLTAGKQAKISYYSCKNAPKATG